MLLLLGVWSSRSSVEVTTNLLLMHDIIAYKESVCARSPCRLLHAFQERHVGS